MSFSLHKYLIQFVHLTLLVRVTFRSLRNNFNVTEYDRNGRAPSLACRAEERRGAWRVGVFNLDEVGTVDVGVLFTLIVPLALLHDSEIEADVLAGGTDIARVLLGNSEALRVSICRKEIRESKVVSLREKVVRAREGLQVLMSAFC
jgi:hypothetical protein